MFGSQNFKLNKSEYHEALIKLNFVRSSENMGSKPTVALLWQILTKLVQKKVQIQLPLINSADLLTLLAAILGLNKDSMVQHFVHTFATNYPLIFRAKNSQLVFKTSLDYDIFGQKFLKFKENYFEFKNTKVSAKDILQQIYKKSIDQQMAVTAKDSGRGKEKRHRLQKLKTYE